MSERICYLESCSNLIIGRHATAKYCSNVCKSRKSNGFKGIYVKRDGVCMEPGCCSPIDVRGRCDRHYKKTQSSDVKDIPARNQEVFDRNGVRGPIPNKGEKGIYFLRRLGDLRPFYVGSTVDPCHRIRRHKRDKDPNIEMVVVRCVPLGDEVYWESRLLVDLYEVGYELENTTTPSKNGTQKHIK